MQRKSLIIVLVGVLGAASLAQAAVDQIIGLSASKEGTALVKRFRVKAGSVITGIEVKNNDDGIVFPRMALYRGKVNRLADAKPLWTKADVGATSRHRIGATFEPIAITQDEEIWVALSWSMTTGEARGVGSGAGLGAATQEEPTDCFISADAEEPLQPVAADLAISLIVASTKAGADQDSLVAEADESPRVVHETFFDRPRTNQGVVTLRFGLSQQAPTRLDIYDVAGRKVRTLVLDYLVPGEHIRTWDGTDEHGQNVASGLYLARLTVSGRALTQKVLISR